MIPVYLLILRGPNYMYPCLEQISIVQKMFEPLFDCIVLYSMTFPMYKNGQSKNYMIRNKMDFGTENADWKSKRT